jgi:hypothetical protein
MYTEVQLNYENQQHVNSLKTHETTISTTKGRKEANNRKMETIDLIDMFTP